MLPPCYHLCYLPGSTESLRPPCSHFAATLLPPCYHQGFTRSLLPVCYHFAPTMLPFVLPPRSTRPPATILLPPCYHFATTLCYHQGPQGPCYHFATTMIPPYYQLATTCATTRVCQVFPSSWLSVCYYLCYHPRSTRPLLTPCYNYATTLLPLVLPPRSTRFAATLRPLVRPPGPTTYVVLYMSCMYIGSVWLSERPPF